MRYWFAILLSFAAPACAENTLYDDLKTASAAVASPGSVERAAVQAPHPFDDTLSQDLEQYLMEKSLREQFRQLNGDEGKDYIPEYLNVNEALPYRYRKLIEDSVYLQVFMVSVIGLLASMPESVSNWNMDELQEKSLQERWYEHVTTKPVWDQDDWGINYIGHPVSGAIYYTMARDDGMSIFESAAYSVLMSTFFWEYGYESFAEKPSIQDLFVTPLVGSFLGEGMHHLEGKLDRQGGVIWGSKVLGNISYFFLNPMGNIANGMSSLLRSYNRGMTVTMTLQNYPRADNIAQFRFTDPDDSPVRFRERDYGFIITLQ